MDFKGLSHLSSWNRISLGSSADRLLPEHKAGSLESQITLSHPLDTPPPCPAGLPIPVPLQWQFSDQPSQNLSCPLEGNARMSSVAEEYPLSIKGSSSNNICKVRDTGKVALI